MNDPAFEPAGRRRFLKTLAAGGGALLLPPAWGQEVLPDLVTAQSIAAVRRGLDYLAARQTSGGSLGGTEDTGVYPTAMSSLAGMAFLAGGNTSTRGAYREQVRGISEFLVEASQQSGLIASGGENGRPMYGHGFALMFLACAFGMETDPARRGRIAEVVQRAIRLTASAASPDGGWMYEPNSGDEGSVTVTQLQGLRAANDAGFSVPQETVNNAVRYLERCETASGGICYSLSSGGEARPPITAAAVCCLYTSGEYDSPLAETCLRFTARYFKAAGVGGFGHDFYANLYAAQAFYQAGDKYWEPYFPKIRDVYVSSQQNDGSWSGDGVGRVYGTSIASIVLQLPYRYLPIYQR